MKRLATLTLWAATFLAGSGVATATDISGTITTTLTIIDNSRFVGDVTCTVVGAPCISFGAPGIVLNLNGHTMIGLGSRDSCPSPVSGEVAISTSGQDDVIVTGPGIVSRFRDNGILVSGNRTQVTRLVVASSCANGLEVQGNANTAADNTVVRASLNGVFQDGIAVLGTGGHSIQRNQVVGASSVTAPGGHGIFVASATNLIEDNNASGNPGVGIFLGNGASDNRIRRNAAFGNVIFHDIFDDNASGANRYSRNTCEVSGGAGAPRCPAVGRR